MEHPSDPSTDPDAWGLPAAAYHDPRWLEDTGRRVLETTWHGLPTVSASLSEGGVSPCTLLPGCLDEPLLLTHDAEGLHLLSNVCPHRGAAVVERAGAADELRCELHGRTFSLAGRARSAPGHDCAEGFPRPCDHLAPVPWARWGPLVFGALRPQPDAEQWLAPLHELLGFALEPELAPVATMSRDYQLPYSWLLCCETELALAYAGYHSDWAAALGRGVGQPEPRSWGVVRLVDARSDEPSLSLPSSHPLHARRLASLHLWLFPGTFVSTYPWGLRVRMVLPLGADRTHLVIRGLSTTPEGLDPTLPAAFDQLEHEDQRRLASVTRGLRSRHAPRPRYAPAGDEGIRRFHRLLRTHLDAR